MGVLWGAVIEQLCDINSGYGTLRCYWGTGSCPGSALGTNDANNCYPYVVWSSKLVGDSNAWSPELYGGRFFEYYGDAGHIKTQAIGVRCVLELLYLDVKVICAKYYTLRQNNALCDRESGYGTLQCYPDYGAGRCPGSANSNCYPYIVWSSKLVGDSNAWSPELNGGRFYEYVGEAGHVKTNAATVRCVLDLFYLDVKIICAKNYTLRQNNALCDVYAGYGTLQCYIGIDSCPGAKDSKCYPYIVWSGKQFEDGSTAWASEVNSGRFFSWNGENGRSSLGAVTVRCVLDVDCYRIRKSK